MSKVMTADEWKIKNYPRSENMWSMFMVKEYAKYILEEHKEVMINSAGFIRITAEKLNSEDYRPFIFAFDNYWTVDIDKLEQAHKQFLANL